MKLYRKLISHYLLFYSLIGLAYTQPARADSTKEPIEIEAIHSPQKKKGKSKKSKEAKEKKITVAQETWQACKERGYNVLSNINPLTFGFRFIFTFPVMHFLIDKMLQNAPGAPIAQPNTFKVFICEGILFYILNTIYNLLQTGTLEVMLAPFQAYNKIYRFLFITLSTSFMGISILLSKWWMSLGILITATVLFSIFVPSAEEDSNPKAYIYTNIIFVIFTWLIIQGVWFAFVTSNNFDDFLAICRIKNHPSDPNITKAKSLEGLLMSNGNLGIFTVWHIFKNQVHVQTGNGYITLAGYLNTNDFLLKPAMDFINGLPEPFNKICNYSIENSMFELAKDLLL